MAYGGAKQLNEILRVFLKWVLPSQQIDGCESATQLQEWYFIQCDGDWEHSFGMSINSAPNQWTFELETCETPLEGQLFKAVSADNSKSDWLKCSYDVSDRKIKGSCATTSLEKLLTSILTTIESSQKMFIETQVETAKNIASSINEGRERVVTGVRALAPIVADLGLRAEAPFDKIVAVYEETENLLVTDKELKLWHPTKVGELKEAIAQAESKHGQSIRNLSLALLNRLKSPVPAAGKKFMRRDRELRDPLSLR